MHRQTRSDEIAEPASDLRDIVTRNAATLLQDMAGVAALVVLLVAGLNLPQVL